MPRRCWGLGKRPARQAAGPLRVSRQPGRPKKKRSQVTPQAARFPTGMRGQSMACSVVEAPALLLPAAAFARPRIDAPEPARNFLPARSFRLGTAFSSPAATALFREPPRRGQRSWPIPSSEFGTLLPARSAFSSHPGPRSSRVPGCSSLKARCQLASPKLSNVHPAFTSLQDSHPSGS